MKKQIIIAVCLLLSNYGAQAQIISTIAGNGTAGYSSDGIAATTSELNAPSGVAVDGSGNMYIADYSNSRIRKVNSSGIISTIAGTGTTMYSGDAGAATAAEIGNPFGITVDASGNVYFSDSKNNVIRKISTSGIITTIVGTGAGGYGGDGTPATSAQIMHPEGIAIDGSGNLYIADDYNNAIRKVNASGVISTYAGTGTAGYGGDGGDATAAKILNPSGVAVDASGDVYIADNGNNVIRKVINSTGMISSVAGIPSGGFSGDGGPATSALMSAYGIAVDASGNIYIADAGNLRIRKVSTLGIINTIAGKGTPGFSGDGSPATTAELFGALALTVDAGGNVYIADGGNNRIRKISYPSTGINHASIASSDITLFPNPSRGLFTINGTLKSTASENVSVEVVNMLGAVVYKSAIATRKGNIHFQVQLADNLATGLYLVKIQSETETDIFRLRVEK